MFGFRIWAVKNSMPRRSAAAACASRAGSRVGPLGSTGCAVAGLRAAADPQVEQRAFYMNDKVLYISWSTGPEISGKSYNAGSLPDVE